MLCYGEERESSLRERERERQRERERERRGEKRPCEKEEDRIFFF